MSSIRRKSTDDAPFQTREVAGGARRALLHGIASQVPARAPALVDILARAALLAERHKVQSTQGQLAGAAEFALFGAKSAGVLGGVLEPGDGLEATRTRVAQNFREQKTAAREGLAGLHAAIAKGGDGSGGPPKAYLQQVSRWGQLKDDEVLAKTLLARAGGSDADGTRQLGALAERLSDGALSGGERLQVESLLRLSNADPAARALGEELVGVVAPQLNILEGALLDLSRKVTGGTELSLTETLQFEDLSLRHAELSSVASGLLRTLEHTSKLTDVEQGALSGLFQKLGATASISPAEKLQLEVLLFRGGKHPSVQRVGEQMLENLAPQLNVLEAALSGLRQKAGVGAELTPAEMLRFQDLSQQRDSLFTLGSNLLHGLSQAGKLTQREEAMLGGLLQKLGAGAALTLGERLQLDSILALKKAEPAAQALGDQVLGVVAPQLNVLEGALAEMRQKIAVGLELTSAELSQYEALSRQQVELFEFGASTIDALSRATKLSKDEQGALSELFQKLGTGQAFTSGERLNLEALLHLRGAEPAARALGEQVLNAVAPQLYVLEGALSGLSHKLASGLELTQAEQLQFAELSHQRDELASFGSNLIRGFGSRKDVSLDEQARIGAFLQKIGAGVELSSGELVQLQALLLHHRTSDDGRQLADELLGAVAPQLNVLEGAIASLKQKVAGGVELTHAELGQWADLSRIRNELTEMSFAALRSFS